MGEAIQQTSRNENYSPRFHHSPTSPPNNVAVQSQSSMFYQIGELVHVSKTCCHHAKYDPFSRDNPIYLKITVRVAR